MAYDMGIAYGEVDLDVSGFEDSVNKMNEDFMELIKASDKVVETIEEQAQVFEGVLAKAYKSMEAHLTPMQKAQQALNTLFDSNREKVKLFANATKEAAQVQEQAHANMVKSYQDLVAAQNEVDEKLKEFNDLSAGKHFDTAQVEKEYLDALEKKNQAQLAYNAAKTAEEAAVQKATQAQRAYDQVLKSVEASEKQAQESMAKFTADSANILQQVNSQRLQDSNKIREANRQEASEREEQLKRYTDALKEAQEVEQSSSKNQVAAFALAAKAVDEVVEGVKKLAQELANLAEQVIDIGSNFETSMAQVAATTGMTAGDVKGRISDYEDLVAAAKEAGVSTIFSAAEAGEALNYLALAGYNVEQSIATMPDILTIAAAGAMDLGRASDMVTDAMNALDLGIGNTSDFIDKMAKTAQSSNTNVEQLGGAILTVGGTATVLAGGVTELDTALGLLANSGIKARQGGTALRQILLNLTAPAKNGAEMIQQLGLQVFDMEGNMRPLNDIFSDLNDIMADFTDQQRMETLNAIFDARQIRAANALLQGCGEAWDNLSAKIENSEGAAERMAETMRSNLNGALNIAKSNLEAIAITLYEGVAKNITDLVKEAIPKFQELNKVLASPEVQARLKAMSAEIKEIALNLLDKLIVAIPKIIDHLANVQKNLETLAVVIGTLSAFKIAASIPQLITSLTTLAAAINPVTAALTVAGATMASVIQMEAEANAEIQKHQALVYAENDAYESQREIIYSLVDEWEKYKETAGEVIQDAQDHASKVKALYDAYVDLRDAGQDTTIAVEALADEIPALKEALADGEVSFEDITKSVDDYCESLIKAAKLEAGKGTYVQAIQTRDEMKKSLNEIEDAARKSQRAFDDYESRFNELNEKSLKGIKLTEEEQAEYEDLIQRNLSGEYSALKKINEDNQKALATAKNAYYDANWAAIHAEEDYLAVISNTAKEEGKVFEDRESGIKAAEEARAKEQRLYYQQLTAEEQAALDEKNQKLLGKLDAGIDDIDRRISLREEGISDQTKIDFYESIFGSNEDWDRNNEDLVKHYDKYMTLQEKKAKEIKKQQENDQKERDRIAKEAQKKQKEQDAEWTKLIEKGLSDIDWTAKYEDWDSSKTLQAYKDYLKENESYYAQHYEKKEALDRKILELDKKSAQEEKKTAEDAAKKYIKAWETSYDKLLKSAEKAYTELEKKREKFQDNLLKGVELYTEKSKSVWNKYTQSYSEDKGVEVSAKNMREQLKEIQNYDKAIEKLRSKNVSEDLITEILGMSPEKGKEYADALNSLSTKELTAYVNAYSEVHKKTDQMTSAYYQKELEKFDQEYMQPLKAYVSGDQSELKKAYETLGQDSVQGYLDGLQTKADEAEGETKKIYTDALSSVKEALGIHSPSTEYYEVGENVIEGFLNGVQSKAEQLANIFLSLGQKAGDSFVNAFKETWDNFVTIWNTSGVMMPQAMIATTYGTPAFAGGQMVYNTNNTSYSGLTKEDIVSAVREALPSGDVVLQVEKDTFGKISRDALNSVAENSEMGLKV